MRDLWDLLHVYVAPSKESDVAGEGLYVRRKIPRWNYLALFENDILINEFKDVDVIVVALFAVSMG